MAFVFMGKGVRELQEANLVPVTVIPGFPHVDAMGLFPSVETLLAQLLLVVLLLFALAKTFWPKRSVALPTVAPSAPVVAPDVAARLAAMQSTIDKLSAKLEEQEQGLGT